MFFSRVRSQLGSEIDGMLISQKLFFSVKLPASINRQVHCFVKNSTSRNSNTFFHSYFYVKFKKLYILKIDIFQIILINNYTSVY